MTTNKLPRTNLSEIIADRVHRDILEGKLRPGDRLPPHEVLCERWGVSRVTLREALKGALVELDRAGHNVQRMMGTCAVASNLAYRADEVSAALAATDKEAP